MVAGDGELWEGELGHEVSGGGELGAAGALGEVAAGDYEVGLEGVEIFEEAFGDVGLVAAEVEVRDVGDGGHCGREELSVASCQLPVK